MKLVTFNIRCDYGQDGDNAFEFRKPLILKTLDREQPDILCFQEVLPHVAVWLRENLKDYCVVGCGREDHLGGEQVPVAFRRKRFNMVQMETFWLSETPYTPGSRYADQSECPRVSTLVTLQEAGTGQVFHVLNTHLDHIGTGARRLGLNQILTHLDELKLFPDAPIVLCGDFNAEPGWEEFQVFADHPGYVNATEGIGITYHGYMRSKFTECIDYVFLKNGILCDRVEKWTDCQDGVYLSDHYPICAELSWDESDRM